MSLTSLIVVASFFLIISFLYSSVGFGGGSSYLAILALYFSIPEEIKSMALLCNIWVVSMSCVALYRSREVWFSAAWKYALVSVPFSFLGATMRLEQRLFFLVLATTLSVSALFLVFQIANSSRRNESQELSQAPIKYIIGMAVGFVSGLVGIGGGIFLSPLLLLFRWEKTAIVPAIASFFILINSISGIGGLWWSGGFQLNVQDVIPCLVAVSIGGFLGIRIRQGNFKARHIKAVTALLIFMVAIRLFVKFL